MPSTVDKLRDLASKLDTERQEMLLEIAEGMVSEPRLFDSLTPSDRRTLETGIAEADRGEEVTASELRARIARVLEPRRP